MSLTRVFHDEDRGLAIATAFIFKDKCKAIPGARWDKELKAWRYPFTPFAAKAIAEQFPPDKSKWSDIAEKLLLEAQSIADSARHKTATTLPEIPVQRVPAWHHQKQCFWFARYLTGVMIAFDMGTGKSRIAIDLIQNREHWQVLILCPKSVVAVWPKEFRKHAVRDYVVITGDEGSVAQRVKHIQQELRLARARLKPAIVVLNYEAAWRDPMEDFLLTYPWECVVLDESHRIKSPSGKSSKFCSRMGDTVPFRMCLTGTPMPHSPLDIYAQYRFLDKGIFGTSFVNFRARYAIMGGYGNHQVQGYQNEQELHGKMYQIAFRVKAEDVQDLPEAIDIVRTCKLSASARAIYRDLDREFVAEVGSGAVTVTNALTKLLRLQQITSGFLTLDKSDEDPRAKAQIRDIDTSKAELLLDILTDLKEEEPVAIFCRFHHDLDTVHEVGKALGRATLELSGRVNQLADWQEGKAPLLAVQISSGGVGIDLVRTCYEIFYSIGYSLGEYLQARKRAHRPGQNRTTRFIHLIAEDTKDQAVYDALEKREDVVESILNTTRARHAVDALEPEHQPAAV